MLWIFLAICANFFWAFMNIGDKYIVSNKIKNPYVYLVILSLVNILVLLIVPFVDFFIPETSMLLWLALAGSLWFLGGLPYIKAMQIEDVTRINLWWNLLPLFTLVIGWITIGQKLNGSQIFALLVLMVGAVIASMHSKGKKIIFSKAILLMMLACLIFSVYAIIFSHVTATIPFVVAFVWGGLFTIPASLVMFVSRNFRKSFREEVLQIDNKLGGLIVFISLLDRVGVFFNVWALSLGVAALVYSFEGFQAIFVFIIVALISFFKPHILKEELDRKNIVLKLVALVFMVVGILILAFN